MNLFSHLRGGLAHAPQDRLQRAEATFEVIVFDAAAARAYARIYAVVASAGRKPRGRRAFDLLIAATALANER